MLYVIDCSVRIVIYNYISVRIYFFLLKFEGISPRLPRVPPLVGYVAVVIPHAFALAGTVSPPPSYNSDRPAVPADPVRLALTC